MSVQSYSIEVVNRIDEIDPGEWDALCQERPSANHRWLRLTEAILAEHRPYYLQLRQAGQLQAAAVCSLTRPAPLLARTSDQVSRALARWIGARIYQLQCEVPVSFDSGLLIRPGCDARRLIPPLLEAIKGLAARERARCVGLRYLSGRDEAWPTLSALGYHGLRLLPEAYLEVSWPTFEAYQAALPSRKRRELRRYRRRAEEAGVTVEAIHPSAEVEPLLRRLVHNVFERHGKHDFYAPDLFSRARAMLGDDLILLVARRAGQITACMALLRNGAELLPRFIGLDYRRTMYTFTYHVLLTECVSKAIELQVRRIWFGSTVYEIKRDLGATLDDRFAALTMRGPLLNRLLGLGLRATGRLSFPPPARANAQTQLR